MKLSMYSIFPEDTHQVVREYSPFSFLMGIHSILFRSPSVSPLPEGETFSRQSPVKFHSVYPVTKEELPEITYKPSFSLGRVDNSDLDVPRLVRGIQFDLTLCNRLAHEARSLDPADKPRDVGAQKVNCQHALGKMPEKTSSLIGLLYKNQLNEWEIEYQLDDVVQRPLSPTGNYEFIRLNDGRIYLKAFPYHTASFRSHLYTDHSIIVAAGTLRFEFAESGDAELVKWNLDNTEYSSPEASKFFAEFNLDLYEPRSLDVEEFNIREPMTLP